jgi:hypothetical protein
MAATGTNKKITAGQVLASGLPGSFSTLAASGLASFSLLSASAAAAQTPTFTSTVNGAAVEVILVGKTSLGAASQWNMGMNRFADSVLSISNGTTEYARLSSTGLAVTGAVSATTTGKVGTTLGVGNATPSASGAGITFPATQSASTDPNTLDDYREGSFTGTLTGCTTSPTLSVDFVRNGNLVTLSIPTTVATSNATTMTITGMPTTLRPASTSRNAFVRTFDNGVYVETNSYFVLDSGGTIAMYKTSAGGGWTNSGDKGIASLCVSYII